MADGPFRMASSTGIMTRLIREENKIYHMTSTAIGIDLGGTRIKGVVINSSGDILSQLYQQIEKDNWKEVIIEGS